MNKPVGKKDTYLKKLKINKSKKEEDPGTGLYSASGRGREQLSHGGDFTGC